MNTDGVIILWPIPAEAVAIVETFALKWLASL